MGVATVKAQWKFARMLWQGYMYLKHTAPPLQPPSHFRALCDFPRCLLEDALLEM